MYFLGLHVIYCSIGKGINNHVSSDKAGYCLCQGKSKNLGFRLCQQVMVSCVSHAGNEILLQCKQSQFRCFKLLKTIFTLSCELLQFCHLNKC